MLCCFCSTSDLFSSVLLSAEPWSGQTRPFSRLGSKAEPGGRGTKEKVVQFSRIQTHGPPYCHRRSSGGTGVSRQLLSLNSPSLTLTSSVPKRDPSNSRTGERTWPGFSSVICLRTTIHKPSSEDHRTDCWSTFPQLFLGFCSSVSELNLPNI